MRLFLLTAITMIAFAANSMLNRLALADGMIDAMQFGSIRLVAGAAALALLSLALRGGPPGASPPRLTGVVSLLVYIFGFSAAYRALDTGLGALILFAMVQITMFTGSLLAREAVPPRRWIGAALALAGLGWLLWPGGGMAVSLWHGFLMATAGLGWGIYSLAGRKAGDPLAATAANFILAAPAGILLAYILTPATPPAPAAAPGILLAIISGAVTSGMGYALWYTVLPRLSGTVAAVAQLTVPVIAMAGGMIVLDEVLTLRFTIAALLVLGGVAFSVLPPVRTGSR